MEPKAAAGYPELVGELPAGRAAQTSHPQQDSFRLDNPIRCFRQGGWVRLKFSASLWYPTAEPSLHIDRMARFMSMVSGHAGPSN
jgi:hypothetical protein